MLKWQNLYFLSQEIMLRTRNSALHTMLFGRWKSSALWGSCGRVSYSICVLLKPFPKTSLMQINYCSKFLHLHLSHSNLCINSEPPQFTFSSTLNISSCIDDQFFHIWLFKAKAKHTKQQEPSLISAGNPSWPSFTDWKQSACIYEE